MMKSVAKYNCEPKYHWRECQEDHRTLISIDNTPQINVPHIDPMLAIEPIHDNSSFVNGPVLSDVLFERSTGKAG